MALDSDLHTVDTSRQSPWKCPANMCDLPGPRPSPECQHDPQLPLGVLCRDVFSAGASHYGVADLELLAKETHKFESRYLDGLIGPYPEMKDVYVQRSPIHSLDTLTAPTAFFQASHAAAEASQMEQAGSDFCHGRQTLRACCPACCSFGLTV